MTVHRGPLRRVLTTREVDLQTVLDFLECGHTKSRRLDVDPVVAKRRCTTCLTEPPAPTTYRCSCGYQVWAYEYRLGDRCPNPYINNGCDGRLGEDVDPTAPGYLHRATGGRYG